MGHIDIISKNIAAVVIRERLNIVAIIRKMIALYANIKKGENNMTKQQEKLDRPICSECKIPMGKNGLGWSGRHKVQRFKCSGCGKVIFAGGKQG